MRHVVRKIVTADRKKVVGFGVFMGWNVVNVLENISISIASCTDPDDKRPLREQHGKAYKMLSLHKTEEVAKTKAYNLSRQKLG